MSRSLVVGRLILDLDGVRGRKRLQKIVHLISKVIPDRLDYRFILYHYGPFSRELAEDIDFLQDLSIITESKPSPQCSYYTYSVGDKEIADLLRELTDAPGQRWVELVDTLKDGNVGTPDLEALSTAVYLHEHPAGSGTMREQFARVKPHLTDRLNTALDLGRKIGLIDEIDGLIPCAEA